MTCDWSGNHIAQQRDDRIVMGAAGVILLVLALMLPSVMPKHDIARTAMVLPAKALSTDTWQLRL